MALNNKIKLMILGYLPPPPEGTAKITEVIVTSDKIRDKFDIFFMELLKRETAAERGKLGVLNLIHNVGNVLRYTLLIIKNKPEIIYLTLAQNKLGFFRDSIFIIIGRFFNARLCVHFHGGNFDLFYQRQNRLYKGYIRFVLRKINHLIVLADKFKKQFSPFISIDKISTLYNCVPEMKSAVNTAGKSIEESETTRILFIGYLSKAKGALDLTRAIPLVIEQYKGPIEFVLCGQPVDIERNITFIPDPHFGYSKIKQMIIDNKLEKVMRIYTSLSSEEKDRLLSTSDIFVFPTYSEGCGLVVLEAMAWGLPVITTKVGALEEMLEENINCFFVEPGNYADLSDCILKLVNSKENARKMGENNRNLLKEKYSQEAFIHKLSNIWYNL